MKKNLRVIINAQLVPGGHSGGIEQFLIGLIHGLGQLDDGLEEYIVIGDCRDPNWLRPYLGANQRIVAGRQPRTRLDRSESLKSLLGPLRGPFGTVYRSVRRVALGRPKQNAAMLPNSDGFFESLGGDIVHFPYQYYMRCSMPAVFNPHDLQHLHYPEFFTEETLSWRKTIYREGCHHAHAVAAESQWVKDDITRQYGIDQEKIFVIPRGSPTELCGPIITEDLTSVRERFRLPEQFVFYPGQTWRHKNHIRLIEAIKFLRDRRNVYLNLVCCGAQNDFWPTIEEHIQKLGLEKQVFFLGFVKPEEVRALYHACQFVVFPSLFEGGGFPLVEAFREGSPIACSSVTSLLEYGGDAVLFFDPTSVEEIAEAMHRMFLDSTLRERLRERGLLRSRLFSWEKTAKAYRALYRKVTGRSLSDNEQDLLGISNGVSLKFTAEIASEGQFGDEEKRRMK